MIRITYKEFPKEGAMRLRAEGHAGYAPKGQDIVCAAVSTLMQALAFSADCSEEGFAVASSSGPAGTYLELQMKATPENRAKFELVTDGLELVAQLYPKFVMIDDGMGTADVVDLQLFAEGAAASGSAAAGGDAAGEGTAEITGPELRPAQERLAKRSRPGKAARAELPQSAAPTAPSEREPVSSTEADAQTGKATGEEQREPQQEQQKPTNPAEKRKAFGQLMQGEYAAEFEEAMQRAAQLAVQSVQENPAVKGLLEALGEAYGIDAGNAENLEALTEAVKSGKVKNDEYYETLAAKRGISVKTARELDRMEGELQRANAEKQRAEQMRLAAEHQQRAAAVRAQWEAEAAQLKEKYPAFELDEVLNNPGVAHMIRCGIGLEAAYRANYFDQLMEASTARTAQQVEQGVAARIQQRAQRPAENGAHPGAAAETKVDVAHMTAKQRAELAKRARRGERIVL